MPHPADALHSRQRQEWWGLLLLLAVVALVLASLRWHGRLQADRAEGERLDGQARAVQQVLAQQLQASYDAMVGLRDDLGAQSAQPAPGVGARRLKAIDDAIPGVNAAVLLDAQGHVLASSRPALRGQDFASALPPQRDPRVLYVRPASPVAGEGTVIQLQLPLDAAPGGGVLMVLLDPEFFRVALRSVLYAPDMRAAVVHGDGTLLLFEPPQQHTEGVNVARAGSFFQTHLDSGREASLFEGVVALGGQPRLVALRTLRPPGVPMDRPLVVTASRDLEDLQAPWRAQIALDLTLFGLLAAATAALLRLMQRRQRDAAVREHLEAERLELALRGADLGLWDLDLRSGRGSVNPRWSEMLGYEPGVLDTDEAGWRALLHPDDAERVVAAQRAHIDGSSASYEAVYRMRHRDGGWIWVLDHGKVVERGPHGEPRRMVGTHMDITGRMEAEQALRRSEESLAITLHSIGDAVIATDPAGHITRINATAERLTGWPEAQALGQPLEAVFRIFNPHTGAVVENPVQEVLARGEVVGLANDTMLHGRDGTAIQIADSAAPIRTADGRIAGVVLVFSDVSERYRAQQALRERERQLSTITDVLPGPVSRADATGRYLFANAAYETWFGVPAAQVLGRTVAEVLGPRLYAKVQPFLARVLAGETVRGEFPFRTASLGRRHALVTMLPDRAADGSVCGLFTIIVDISERKQAEDGLRRSEQNSRELLEHLLTGVVVHGADTRVVEANPAACTILGLTLEQMRGKAAIDPAWRFVEEDGTPMALQRFPVSQVVASCEPMAPLALGIQRPDRSEITWGLATAFPVLAADGTLAQVVVTFIDISERKRAEAERRLLEQQLRESQKMESIGTLAGGIAHDFNNILAAILGNAGLARDDVPADHPVQTSLAQIEKAGQRARSLVQQILAFSRRQPGVLAVQPLRPVVDETLGLLRATLPAAVRLDTRLPEAAVLVRADATQLQQVLMNLATNAWHALPAAGGRIEIGFESVENGTKVHLWVRDDGSGMDPATASRIFDPFFTTKPVGQGTGLGLSVVHGIVRAHDGTIEVDSAVGSGSTFHIVLPAPPLPVAGAAAEPARSSALPGGGRHVLLVDDDEVVLVMAERLLQRAGFSVTPCPAPAEALALVRAGKTVFDAVVTDFNMPGMSGLELAALIAEQAPQLPVILSSGLVSEELHERARRAGVRALLKKEHSFEDLATTVQRVLEQVAAAR